MPLLIPLGKPLPFPLEKPLLIPFKKPLPFPFGIPLPFALVKAKHFNTNNVYFMFEYREQHCIHRERKINHFYFKYLPPPFTLFDGKIFMNAD
jgi:hypothetical protein